MGTGSEDRVTLYASDLDDEVGETVIDRLKVSCPCPDVAFTSALTERFGSWILQVNCGAVPTTVLGFMVKLESKVPVRSWVFLGMLTIYILVIN